MKTGRARADHFYGLPNNRGESAFVDIAHRKGMDSRAAHIEALDIIHAAQTDERHRRRLDLGRGATNLREFARPQPDATGQRHSMYIAAGAG